MKSKLITSYVIGVAICLFFIGTYKIGYLWLTYIDETITVGEGYGFAIGDTKAETYRKIGSLKEPEFAGGRGSLTKFRCFPLVCKSLSLKLNGYVENPVES